MDTLQRLVSLWTVLSTVLLTAITTAILLGQQQPPTTWSEILHFNECELPCWIGIIPGETTLADGRTYIEQTYADTSLYLLDSQQDRFRVTHLPTGHQFRITFWTNDGITETPQSLIQTIFLVPLSPDNNQLIIPDLYSELGNTEAVQLISGVEKEYIILLYKKRQVFVFVDDLECDKVTLRQAITQIILVEGSDILNWTWISEPHMWQGFGRCYNFTRQIWP